MAGVIDLTGDDDNDDDISPSASAGNDVLLLPRSSHQPESNFFICQFCTYLNTSTSNKNRLCEVS